jgi:hypothetical protein
MTIADFRLLIDRVVVAVLASGNIGRL